MTRSKRTTDEATAELPETEQRSAKKQRRPFQQETDDDASMVETDSNGHSEEPNAAERNGSEESDSTETIERCVERIKTWSNDCFFVNLNKLLNNFFLRIFA